MQFVPHVANEIKEQLFKAISVKDGDSYVHREVCIVEVGGTIGDIESSIYFEVIRQLVNEYGRKKIFNIHVSFVHDVQGEQKTKPTQTSVTVFKSIQNLLYNILII